MPKALIIITHGETRGENRNTALSGLAALLQNHPELEHHDISAVYYGVLSGQPTVANALHQAAASHADETILYPLFMSEGYFTKTALPDRIKAANCAIPITTLPPLGSDPALTALLYRMATRTLAQTGWDITGTRLLVVGHGSGKSPVSADATRHHARMLRAASEFAAVETAFLEEEPFLEILLEKTASQPTIIAGYFTGSGLHGGQDIAHAIKKTGAQAIYTGPAGSSPDITGLVVDAVTRDRA